MEKARKKIPEIQEEFDAIARRQKTSQEYWDKYRKDQEEKKKKIAEQNKIIADRALMSLYDYAKRSMNKAKEEESKTEFNVDKKYFKLNFR